MRWFLLCALLHPASLLCQQSAAVASVQQPVPVAEVPPGLPDSPGAAQTYRQNVSVTTSATLPCKPGERPVDLSDAKVQLPGTVPSCAPRSELNPYQRFLNSPAPFPLTSRQKGLLALHNLVDPGNLFTITANAGFTTGIDSHTAYGPGWRGFGRNIGYSLVQNATGEFLSTYAVDSLFHEDPHYHRAPKASVPRRFLHAVSHTVISQHDDGTPMINYSTLLTYPISAEISNLYVPGVHGNGPSTVKRVAIGLASDPIDSLITEFLPDFARRVHIRVVFAQQILNNIASTQPL